MTLRSVILIGGALVGMLYKHKVKELLYDCVIDNVTSLFCNELKIYNHKNPKSAYAMKNELASKLGF